MREDRYRQPDRLPSPGPSPRQEGRSQIHQVLLGCRRTGLVLALLAWASAGLVANPASASQRLGESVGLLVDDLETAEIAQRAVAQWERCPGYGTDFPFFKVAGKGTRVLRIEVRWMGDQRCGSFQGSSIVVYRHQVRNGVSGPVPCGDPALILAHELGHALGLDDVEFTGARSLHVMAWTTRDNKSRRGVQTAECEALGRLWLTSQELAQRIPD